MYVIERQGAVVAAYVPVPSHPPKPHDCQRGAITEFSAKSRRRCLIFFNRVDWQACKVVFLTLTFWKSPEPKEAKAAFKRFRSWLAYHYPDVAAVWRMEFQERGAAHFHLLLFGLPFIPQKQLQQVWQACTREVLSIVDIRLVKSRKHAMKYVSKYIAKRGAETGTSSLEIPPYQQKPALPSIGRVWGWINAEGIPMCPVERFETTDRNMVDYLRWWMRTETHGRCGNNFNMAICFFDDAPELWGWIKQNIRLKVPLPPDEGKVCYNSHQLPNVR
jgi:hypothetical protein